MQAVSLKKFAAFALFSPFSLFLLA